MLTSNHSTDRGGIRGLSELLMIKEVMHRFMVKENTKWKADGQALLTDLPKPCDYFDLIGGTSTGGQVAALISSVIVVSLIWFPPFESYRIIAFMLRHLRMDVDMAIKHYHQLAKYVFSDPKPFGRDGKHKAMKLEEVIKSVVKGVTGDSESPLLEGDEDQICRT